MKLYILLFLWAGTISCPCICHMEHKARHRIYNRTWYVFINTCYMFAEWMNNYYTCPMFWRKKKKNSTCDKRNGYLAFIFGFGNFLPFLPVTPYQELSSNAELCVWLLM